MVFVRQRLMNAMVDKKMTDVTAQGKTDKTN